MHASPLWQVLDLARWAPSGDNTQPWRFEVVDERRFVVHGHDTRDHCVYDLDGHPSQISLGALVETAAVAASAHGLRLHASRRADSPDERPVLDIELIPAPGVAPSPLLAAIPRRSVQRRPYASTPLAPTQRQALEAALPAGYRLHWLDSPAQRRAAAALMFTSAKIRLTIPEAFEVHRSIIHWGVRYSADRVPSQALGVDPLSAALMKFGLQSWARVRWLNRYCAGTVLPRLQMDWWPALRCAAHVAIVADTAPVSIDDYIAGGRAVQRLWLTATQLGLQHQPEITPLVFSRYAREGRRFTTEPSAVHLAARVARRLDELLGGHCAQAVWLARIGAAPQATARSERHSLQQLLTNAPPADSRNARPPHPR